MIKNALFAAAAIATLSAGAPAFAGQVAVTYKDLDLSTRAGQDALARRLDKAARDACDYDTILTGSRVRSSDALRCYKEAKARNQDTLASILEDKRMGG